MVGSFARAPRLRSSLRPHPTTTKEAPLILHPLPRGLFFPPARTREGEAAPTQGDPDHEEKNPRKLAIARETLGPLEEGGLKNAAGAATTRIASVCICETDLCITLQYSNCNINTCNCS